MAEGIRKAALQRWAAWLATVAVLGIYLPFVAGTLRACKAVSEDVFLYLFFAPLLAPPLCALGAAWAMAHSSFAKSKSRNSTVIWAALMLGAFAGWPISFFTGAVLAYHGSWISH